MIDEKLLELVQCPISRQKLQIADPQTIKELNEKIAQKSLRDSTDQLVESPLDQGLITMDGARLYPVRGGIPTLVADAAIELSGTDA